MKLKFTFKKALISAQIHPLSDSETQAMGHNARMLCSVVVNYPIVFLSKVNDAKYRIMTHRNAVDGRSPHPSRTIMLI